MTILIQNGQVIDPANNIDAIQDILIENGIIAKVGTNLPERPDTIMNAQGMWVVPGFIDLHVHLREPGYEHKETIATGTQSAAAGGFATVCPMPNTKPVTDSAEVVAYVLDKAKQSNGVHVCPIGSITLGQRGETLANFAQMKEAGICALSEDGRTVQDEAVMAQAVLSAKELDIPIFSHCEDEQLVEGGVMNKGEVSEKLCLLGISHATEDVIIARDIRLTEQVGGKLHICHVSTKDGIELIRQARKSNPNITGEVCPHHFTLTEAAILATGGTDTNLKMNPPLRTQEDVDAILAGLADGTITVIATDHAPHTVADKEGGFPLAANGIVGLETAFALSKTALVDTGILTPSQLVANMSWHPAQVLNSQKGTLTVGACADVTIVNPNDPHTIDINLFHSKSKNSPYHGYAVTGRVQTTIVSGRIIYDY